MCRGAGERRCASEAYSPQAEIQARPVAVAMFLAKSTDAHSVGLHDDASDPLSGIVCARPSQHCSVAQTHHGAVSLVRGTGDPKVAKGLAPC